MSKVFANNKRSSYDYELSTRYEAGLVLMGSEVKSIRDGKVNISESFIVANGTELFLHNANVSEYPQAKLFGHSPRRDRKLLLKRKEINRLIGSITRKGMTLVPTKIYLNSRGIIKIEIALAVGKKKGDKRESIKQKDWDRQKQRLLKMQN